MTKRTPTLRDGRTLTGRPALDVESAIAATFENVVSQPPTDGQRALAEQLSQAIVDRLGRHPTGGDACDLPGDGASDCPGDGTSGSPLAGAGDQAYGLACAATAAPGIPASVPFGDAVSATALFDVPPGGPTASPCAGLADATERRSLSRRDAPRRRRR